MAAVTIGRDSRNKSVLPARVYRVSLKAVIRDADGKVLVNKEYDQKNWSLPGGGWEHGETEHQALARELKEEIDYEGQFKAIPKATTTFWLDSMQCWLLWIVYEVVTDNMNFGVGQDSTAIAFIDPAEFRKNSGSEAEQWIGEHL